VLIQQDGNAMVAPDDQLIEAVLNGQGGFESSMAFEASTISNHLGALDLSELSKRVLQEVPEAQKEAIHLAAKGMSWREIAAKGRFPWALPVG
jgi:hypothetical protein